MDTASFGCPIREAHQVRRINLRPDIRVLQERSGMALLHGDNGMAQLVMARAANLAIDKGATRVSRGSARSGRNHAGSASALCTMPLRTT